MIPTLVKIPFSLAQQAAIGLLRGGVGVATTLLHRVLPGGETRHDAPAQPETSQPKTATQDAVNLAPVVDITPPKPRVNADPVIQPPAPEQPSTPGATTTIADPAPATATPATRATARQATARKGPAKKTPAKKAPASDTAAQKAVAKKTPAKKAAPTKSAATLNEPAAPLEDDPIVYSSGPDA